MRTRRNISGGSAILAANIIFLAAAFSLSASFFSAQANFEDVEGQGMETIFSTQSTAASSIAAAGTKPETNKPAKQAKPAQSSIKPVKSMTAAGGAGCVKAGDSFILNRSGLQIDFTELLRAKPALQKLSKKGPQVLIIHTHTTESFMQKGSTQYDETNYTARSLDNSKNMAAVGDAFAKQLEGDGISVVHDKTQNDYPEYNGAYTRTEGIIKEYLHKYPSIRAVIDLHRDSLTADDGTKYKLCSEEKGASQVMIVAGSGEGGLAHKNYIQNLRLAALWQQQMDKDFKKLARPVDFVKYRYNQHLTCGSLILEVGTDANSLDEACEAAYKSAASLARVLKTIA